VSYRTSDDEEARLTGVKVWRVWQCKEYEGAKSELVGRSEEREDRENVKNRQR